MPQLDHTPWKPGWLAAKVAPIAPSGAPQALVMMLAHRAKEAGMPTVPIDTVEVAISVVDDAIEHMMIMSRIQ